MMDLLPVVGLLVFVIIIDYYLFDPLRPGGGIWKWGDGE